MAAMPAGPRLFRAPPLPDIQFTHALLPDAERDASLLRKYVEEKFAVKQSKSDLKKDRS